MDHFPIRKPARRAEPGKRAERSDGPLFAPLKQVSGLLAWANADPRNTPGYVCGLVSATAEAVLSAMKNGRPGGWIFVQENFIRAVRAIRDMNDARGTAYTDRDLEERFPAAWSRMADAVETCARVVPRPCAGVRRIPRDVLGCPAETPEFGWSRPIRGDALQGLFDYCLETAKAALTSPTDRATVDDNYKSGVFNDREENRRTLSLHTNMLHKAAQDHARIEEKLDSVAAKLDSIGADAKRGADAAEANGAKLDAAGGERAADEKAEARHRETLAAIAANGAKLDVLVGRAGDKEVSAAQMAEIISDELSKIGNDKGITQRTIQNWDAFINHGGSMGTQPPEGYTLCTRRTWMEARAFAIAYARSEASRLKKRVAFNDLKHYKP